MRDSKICKWFYLCPLKSFFEQGILNEKWMEDYCRSDYLRCVRYKLEEEGVYHPDNMMPEGTIEDEAK